MMKKHYRANIGHQSSKCFRYFDNEDRMFEWISNKTGTEIRSVDDCIKWSCHQRNLYIEIIRIDCISDFYRVRRKYIQKVKECENFNAKAQRKPRKRNYYLEMSQYAFGKAEDYAEANPEVWQGEI